MLPGISSKLDLENATMWQLCQEFFLFFLLKFSLYPVRQGR